jgi:hypothetical protein
MEMMNEPLQNRLEYKHPYLGQCDKKGTAGAAYSLLRLRRRGNKAASDVQSSDDQEVRMLTH